MGGIINGIYPYKLTKIWLFLRGIIYICKRQAPIKPVFNLIFEHKLTN